MKEVSRIQSLLCIYFFVLLVQALLERELRGTMSEEELESLPLYPERRKCRAPTTRCVLDLLEPVQRHELRTEGDPDLFFTELTPLQRKIVAILGVTPKLLTAQAHPQWQNNLERVRDFSVSSAWGRTTEDGGLSFSAHCLDLG